MVAMNELDKFVNKFKCLFQSGSDVRLIVNAKARMAEISLHVNVSLEESSVSGNDTVQGLQHRNGVKESPCKRRRRERRKAAREAKGTAEEVTVKTDTDISLDVTRQFVKAEMSDDIQYEVQVDAHSQITNFDILEALEVNFDGAMNDRNVDDQDPCRHILVHKVEEEDYHDEQNVKMNDRRRRATMGIFRFPP